MTGELPSFFGGRRVTEWTVNRETNAAAGTTKLTFLTAFGMGSPPTILLTTLVFYHPFQVTVFFFPSLFF